jgi:hypothetical protein
MLKSFLFLDDERRTRIKELGFRVGY